MENQRHKYHYTISFALLVAAGMWGMFWLPQRALESGGLTGGWATISQMIIPFMILIPISIWRKTKGQSLGLEYPLIGLLFGGGIACYANSFLLTDIVLHHDISSPLCPNQIACMNDVNHLVTEFITCFLGLHHSLFRQINISPACEPVFRIPNRLAMANKNQLCQIEHLEFGSAPGLMEAQSAFHSTSPSH